jgi:nicotinamidase-related amidase
MSASPRRALLVIDVQNEYVSGDLPIEYPPVASSLNNIGRAIDAAQAASIPVIVVQNSAPTASPVFAKGSAGWELHEVVTSRPYSHYIEKSLPSAFAGTDLAEYLAAQAVDTLVVVGYMTHNCDDSTVRQAMHLGLAVEFLADAAGSLPYENAAGKASAEEIHRIFTVVMHSRFAAVATTEAWISALATGLPLPRGNIYTSNRQARGLLKTA